MMPVHPKPEPAMFDGRVRHPGKKFLDSNPTPSSKDYRSKNFWSRAASELHAAYKGICAYTCMYTLPPGSVDHFLPKTSHPQLAYEWSNYRFATGRVNQHKGNRTNIIDPFVAQTGWFQLDFPSCLVRAGDGLTEAQVVEIDDSILALKLNDDDVFVQERCDIMLEYADGAVDLGFLTRRYPFLAAEITRQGLEDTAHTLFKRRA